MSYQAFSPYGEHLASLDEVAKLVRGDRIWVRYMNKVDHAWRKGTVSRIDHASSLIYYIDDESTVEFPAWYFEIRLRTTLEQIADAAK